MRESRYAHKSDFTYGVNKGTKVVTATGQEALDSCRESRHPRREHSEIKYGQTKLTSLGWQFVYERGNSENKPYPTKAE